jgi:hypothetical protein
MARAQSQVNSHLTHPSNSHTNITEVLFQAETALLSNSTATLAAELKNFVGSSSAKSAEKLRFQADDGGNSGDDDEHTLNSLL